MADQKLSELDPIPDPIVGTDLIYIVRADLTFWKGTIQQLLDIIPGASVDWGEIGGTLGNQTDLQAELDGKAPVGDIAGNGQTMNEARLLGRGAGLGNGPIAEITVGAGLNISAGGNLTATAAAPAWGEVTGTLSNQTDLQTALNLKAPLASPALTGTPTAPTAAPGTNTTQVATTAFVAAASSVYPPGLYPSVAAANQNFVFEGDSLSVAGTWSDTNFNTRAWANGHNTTYIIASLGQDLAGIVAHYTASVYPRRPTGSITKAYLFVWIGANDIIAGGSSGTWLTTWNAYMAQARTDGFTVVAFTILPRGVLSATETKRREINVGIRTSPNWDVLIETALLFPDDTDLTWYNVDQTHLNAAANLRLAAYVNAKMTAADAVPLPPVAITTGTADPDVPTNAILKGTTRAYTAAQGITKGVLVDAATVSWDVAAKQTAQLTLGGNRTVANPTNPAAGFWYTLLVAQDATGSRTITWGSKYKWPGSTAPTLATAASHADLLRFFYDGTNMIGFAAGLDYDITVPTPYVISEQFAPTGSDQNMDSTPADTLDVPGTNWAVAAGTATRINSTGRGSIGANSFVSIDSALANVTVEATYYPVSGFGGIVVRSTDSSNYFMLLVQDSGTNDWSYYKVVAGGLSLLDSGTGLSIPGGGTVMRVVTSGNVHTIYWNAVLLSTVTDSFNNTATKIGLKCFNAISVDNFTAI